MQFDQFKKTLYQISNAVSTTDDLVDLYRKIHLSLSNIIDVTNFYIALYDSREEMIYFPYYVDERSQQKTGYKYPLKSGRGSLTSWVIQKGEADIFRRRDVLALCKELDVEPSGPVSEIWLGVPLVVKKEVIGVVAVQSYTDPDCYDENDLKLLSSISDQIAIAIDRKKNQTQYKNLVENIKDVIYITNSSGKMTYVSPATLLVTGYSPSELKDTCRWQSGKSQTNRINFFIHPVDQKKVHSLIKEAVDTLTPFEYEYRIVKKDGSVIWVLDRGQPFRDNLDRVYLEGVITDIQERKRAERINAAFYNISNAVNTTSDLDELYLSIYESLKPIINIEHFSIGLYDHQRDTITFTFSSATREIEHPGEILQASRSTSLTAEVIRQKKPIVFTREEQLQFAASQGGKIIGTPSEFWLGVPLIVGGNIIGAMLTETLDNSKAYSREDVDCFMSVSDQVAFAIERKRNEEQILTREKVITSLYRISSAMHTTTSLHQLYQSIHRILEDIIDVQNFSIALYDEEKDTLYFQYSSDKVDKNIFVPIKNASHSGSLTYKVINEEKSILINKSNKEERLGKYARNLIGEKSTQCWLGVPLRGKSKILGAIVNQSYTDLYCYNEKHITLLEAVSDQIAFAIEYKNAETGLAYAQKELVEKAHKAGMADIASDTIHNLGDIMNSVRISNELISGILKNSHIDHFNKAMDLLQEKMNNLKEFVCNDPNGEKLMQYIITIEQSLASEFLDISGHTERLTEKVALMTNAIRTQQNYVNEEYVEEDCSIEDIINKLLTMHGDNLKNSGIKVIKNYAYVPQILVQKTKLEHVIMNLISNAKDSLKNNGDKEKTLTVALDQDSDNVYLRFHDNGEGIAKENLNRIFSHGFTTKARGQGFGLHNAANFLSEMKGKIWAESDGPGKGATFVLRFQKR
ncbi:GAF domain-containing protein [bacterium]|nr:GAF domain-containing protein [bacterium]